MLDRRDGSFHLTDAPAHDKLIREILCLLVDRYIAEIISVREEWMMKKRELRWYTGLTLGLCCLFLMMLCAVAAAEVEVNEANFPDDNFRKFILEEYAGGDQVLTDAEIAKVTSVYCSAMEIYNMQGIEYFTAMTSLSCAVNNLRNLFYLRNKCISIVCIFRQQ